MSLYGKVFIMIFLSVPGFLNAQEIATYSGMGVKNQLFYYGVIPAVLLIVVAHILVRKGMCVIFYGRKDQMNCFLTFTLPPLLALVLYFILSIFELDENIAAIAPLVVSLLIFLYGFFHLVRNAIIANRNSLVFLPFVLVMKIFIGFFVGLAFVFSIVSWSQNLRYMNSNVRGWIWIIRLFSIVLGGIFILIANLLTVYPELADEKNLKGFEGENPLGRYMST